MRALVAEAIDAGAIGFSTSHATSHVGAYGKPVPSRLAALDEICTLAGELGTRGVGIVEATWGPDLFVDEFAALSEARSAGRSRGRRSWPRGASPTMRPTWCAAPRRAGGTCARRSRAARSWCRSRSPTPARSGTCPASSRCWRCRTRSGPRAIDDKTWRAKAAAQISAAWGEIVDQAQRLRERAPRGARRRARRSASSRRRAASTAFDADGRPRARGGSRHALPRADDERRRGADRPHAERRRAAARALRRRRSHEPALRRGLRHLSTPALVPRARRALARKSRLAAHRAAGRAARASRIAAGSRRAPSPTSWRSTRRRSAPARPSACSISRPVRTASSRAAPASSTSSWPARRSGGVGRISRARAPARPCGRRGPEE